MKQIKLLSLILIVFLVGCNNINNKNIDNLDHIKCCPPTIILQPCNDFSVKEASNLVPKLKSFIEDNAKIEIDFEVRNPIVLNDSLKNNEKSRYDAVKIINYLRNESSDHNVIIVLTHNDIFIPKYRGKQNWGVLGLSFTNDCYTCVASDFRLKNKSRDLWKIAIHEFIHSYFHKSHCSSGDTNCIMQDAKGHANFSNKSYLCINCKKYFNI